MSRFTSLEFGDHERSNEKPQNGEPVRDEMYFYERARMNWLYGDFELALRNYSRSLERNSSFFPAWSGQIYMLLELGEYPEAIVWSKKALELFPEHPELFSAMAIAHSRDAKFEKAMAYSDNSVSRDNITWRIWLARAEVLMKRKSRVAQSCISKAISIAGNDKNFANLEAGRILRRNGKYSAAMEHLNDSVKFFPKSALAWYELGYCQASVGFSQAAVSLQQSLHYRPKWELAESQLNRVENTGLLKRLFRKLIRK